MFRRTPSGESLDARGTSRARCARGCCVLGAPRSSRPGPGAPRRGADLDRDAGVLWQDALRHLAQHVSRPNFTTWLESTEGVRLDGDTLVVGTRSEFVTEWLQKRLLPLI